MTYIITIKQDLIHTFCPDQIQQLILRSFYEEPFEKFFSLSEVELILPDILQALDKAKNEIVFLKKRIQTQEEMVKRALAVSRNANLMAIDSLRYLYVSLETMHAKWIDYFGDLGVILQDIESRQIAFPYQYFQINGKNKMLWWMLNENDKLSLEVVKVE